VHHTVAKTNADFWASKVAATRKRDEETNQLLVESSWAVLRIWEHEAPAEAAGRVLAQYERLSEVLSG